MANMAEIQAQLGDVGYWKERTYQAETKYEANRQTLRDQFAMAALTGQCVDNSNPNVEPTPIQEWDHEYIAKGCYMMADAMLKQREEGRDNEH
jgi:hypothetical protein